MTSDSAVMRRREGIASPESADSSGRYGVREGLAPNERSRKDLEIGLTRERRP